MSWKKIIALTLFLAALIAVIATVNQREKARKAVEGILLDVPAASVGKIELRNQNGRFVFSRRDPHWYLEEPLAVKADKVTLESILDNFTRLRYDRLVGEDVRDLTAFGLDHPGIELKLHVSDQAVHVVQLGLTNSMDDSSYAKLGQDARVVSLAAYKRSDLEKDLFAYRDKKFFALDTMAVTALDYRLEGNPFSLARKGGHWHLEKPLVSQAQDSKVEDILSAASLLEALDFSAATAEGALREHGLDDPLLTAEFRSASTSRSMRVGKKGDQYFALVDGANEICRIGKDFLDRFPADPSDFREKRIAQFYAYDVRELAFQRGALRFTVRQDAEGEWRFAAPAAGKTASREKINGLLTSLADCQAREFVDHPKSWPDFPVRIVLQVEDAADPQKKSAVVMQFSDPQGETVIARNPELTYGFRVGKEILEKLPAKLEDMAEEAPPEASGS
ncbi:MAG: DUF4340 domain-containing protein [Candidatus Aminicenantes bacterium]|nr:DUF4340 domain-containing protein [Candidatus Aminicenantes bacterium]